MSAGTQRWVRAVYGWYSLYTMVDPMKPLNVTAGRARFGSYVERAARHHPVAFSNQGETAVMLGVEDITERLLGDLHFNPEVFLENGSVSIWLPELEIYGIGESLDAAVDDLVEEVQEYVAEYFGDVDRHLSSPNRRAHYPYLVKAQALGLRGQLREGIAGEVGAAV